MPAFLQQIEHIVVVMLENRGFDHVLGWLYDDQTRPRHNLPTLKPGERPFEGLAGLDLAQYTNTLYGSPTPLSDPILYCTAEPKQGTSASGVPQWNPHEDYLHVNEQLFNAAQPTASVHDGKSVPQPANMKGFLQDYASLWSRWSAANQEEIKQIMETYTPDQLGTLNGLARDYGVSDMWFSSVPTQTNPNRAFLMCGTSLGRAANLHESAVEQFDTPSIFNQLGQDWGLFYHHYWLQHQMCYTQYTFPQIEQIPGFESNILPIIEFYRRARLGTLPAFSFIEAAWFLTMNWVPIEVGQFGTGNDYHPPGNTTDGEVFLGKVYDALRENEQAWQKTLLIVTFDEHGGTYDHYSPPWGAVPPDQVVDPNVGYGFAFDRFGVRVPALLISPWIEPGTVFRSATDVPFDHTSIIATVLSWRGISRDNWNLGKRAARAPTFEHVLTRSTPRPVEHRQQGDPIQYGDPFYLLNRNGSYVVAAEISTFGQNYPRVGAVGPVRLKLRGGLGQVSDQAMVEIVSTEDALEKYCMLGAFGTHYCYYYLTGYAEQNWTLTKKAGNPGDTLKYGDQIQITNHNPKYDGYVLINEDQYLTTVKTSDEWWTLVPPPPPVAPGAIVRFGDRLRLRHQSGDYVIAAEAGIAPWNYNYPRLGNTGAVVLTLGGGTAELTDGCMVQIITTERAVGPSTMLGAWETHDCFYYSATGTPAQEWTIAHFNPGQGPICYGQQVALSYRNPRYFGYCLVRDGAYLTTRGTEPEWWTLEAVPLP